IGYHRSLSCSLGSPDFPNLSPFYINCQPGEQGHTWPRADHWIWANLLPQLSLIVAASPVSMAVGARSRRSRLVIEKHTTKQAFYQI
ncbi:MAG: hypothetical protein P8179_25045, partial [Candidatus Thiodiazotropha sp.]